MDIKMFFEFPGVLITIGVFLLVVSIVIGIIAYKNPVDDIEEIEDIKSKLKGKDEHHEEKEYTSEENFLDKEVVEDNKIDDETKLEPTVEVEENDIPLEENKEDIEQVSEEDLGKTEVLDTSLFVENKEEPLQESLEKTENLDDVKDEIMSLLSDIDNKEVEETKKEELPKTIYGGANPSANIKLDNEIKEKVPYEEKTIDLEKTEDLINTLNKETVKNEEEDIEIL